MSCVVELPARQVAEADEIWERTRLLQKIAADMYSEKTSLVDGDASDKFGGSLPTGDSSMGSGLAVGKAGATVGAAAAARGGGLVERSY